VAVLTGVDGGSSVELGWIAVSIMDTVAVMAVEVSVMGRVVGKGAGVVTGCGAHAMRMRTISTHIMVLIFILFS
jgi:hypothetical protein